MKYKFLLFDLDNTLLDFHRSEKESLSLLYSENGIVMSEEMYKSYYDINVKLWEDCEKGLVSLDEVLNTRFSIALRKQGIEVDGKVWETKYREYLDTIVFLMEDALEVIDTLSKNHRLFIITNGVKTTQMKRLTDSNLLQYFERVFISGDIGYQKPAVEYFDYVAQNIEGFDKKKALVIGDRISSDIQGGINAGIDTCLFTNEEVEAIATYRIRGLKELCEILK